MDNKRIYDNYAFISYKREDEKWAEWLQRKLEGYKLPTILKKIKSVIAQAFTSNLPGQDRFGGWYIKR